MTTRKKTTRKKTTRKGAAKKKTSAKKKKAQKRSKTDKRGFVRGKRGDGATEYSVAEKKRGKRADTARSLSTRQALCLKAAAKAGKNGISKRDLQALMTANGFSPRGLAGCVTGPKPESLAGDEYNGRKPLLSRGVIESDDGKMLAAVTITAEGKQVAACLK